VLNGRYGPYVTDKAKNARVPKDRDPKTLTLEECKALLAAAPAKGTRGRFGRKFPAKGAAKPATDAPAAEGKKAKASPATKAPVTTEPAARKPAAKTTRKAATKAAATPAAKPGAKAAAAAAARKRTPAPG